MSSAFAPSSSLMKFSRNFAEFSRTCWDFFFLKNSDKISWILTECWPNSNRSKIRMIRSLGNRIFQPWGWRAAAEVLSRAVMALEMGLEPAVRGEPPARSGSSHISPNRILWCPLTRLFRLPSPQILEISNFLKTICTSPPLNPSKFLKIKNYRR